jgi:hypothetical protein
MTMIGCFRSRLEQRHMQTAQAVHRAASFQLQIENPELTM